MPKQKNKKSIYLLTQEYLERNKDAVKNLTELEKTIGVGPTSLYRLNGGNGFVKRIYLEKIAEFFDKEIEDVLEEYNKNMDRFKERMGLK